MKVLDLFAGIGGFSLAAHWMGWETAAFVEKDEFCQGILKKNFTGVPIYGDITEFDGRPFRGAVDIISGGFPCQPFSQAGKQEGRSDDRHLFPEMLRVIKEVRPRWVIAENVRGILSIEDGNVFEEVCSLLEGEGYEVQTFCIPASAVNAPHRRDRIWFVARHSAGGVLDNSEQALCGEHTADTTRGNATIERPEERVTALSLSNRECGSSAYSQNADGRDGWGSRRNALHEGRRTGEDRGAGIPETAERQNGLAVGDAQSTTGNGWSSSNSDSVRQQRSENGEGYPQGGDRDPSGEDEVCEPEGSDSARRSAPDSHRVGYRGRRLREFHPDGRERKLQQNERDHGSEVRGEASACDTASGGAAPDPESGGTGRAGNGETETGNGRAHALRGDIEDSGASGRGSDPDAPDAESLRRDRTALEENDGEEVEGTRRCRPDNSPTDAVASFTDAELQRREDGTGSPQSGETGTGRQMRRRGPGDGDQSAPDSVGKQGDQVWGTGELGRHTLGRDGQAALGHHGETDTDGSARRALDAPDSDSGRLERTEAQGRDGIDAVGQNRASADPAAQGSPFAGPARLGELREETGTGLDDRPELDDSDDTHAEDEGLQGREERGSYCGVGEEPDDERFGRCDIGDWSRSWLEAAAEFCRMDDGLPAELDGSDRKVIHNAVAFFGREEVERRLGIDCSQVEAAVARIDRLKALGNAVVPQVVYEILCAIEEAEEFKYDERTDG